MRLRTLAFVALLAGACWTAALPGECAVNETKSDPIATLCARLTPEGRELLGVAPASLRPEGHELARCFLKPLAEGAGLVSPEEARSRVGNPAAWQERADRVLRHQVSLLGGLPMQDLGDPIDWFRAPEGDWQWPTHLSRHYWMLPAAYYYRGTGKPEYAAEIVKVLLDWVAKTPIGAETLQSRGGGNTPEGTPRQTVEGTFKGYVDGPWTSLSAHARVDYWTELFQLIWDAPAMNNEAVAVLLNSLVGDHRQIMLEYPRAMNQYQGIAASLIRLGFCYPYFEGVAEGERVGWQRLLKHTTGEIYPDGSLAECSPNYSGGCVNRLHTLILDGERRGRTVPPELKQRVALAARYLALFSDPLLRSPRIAKGGESVVKLLQKLNQTANDPEVAFVLSRGQEGRKPEKLSHAFPWAGHFAMRSGWDERATWLFFDAGPRGSGHHDLAQLNIQLIANGEWLLTDPGYYTYSSEGEPGRMSRYLYSTAAHNTALVDGLPQLASAPGTSRGPNKAPGTYLWEDRGDTVTAEGLYSYGYGEGGKVKVTHRRRVVFHVAENRFVITDTFAGEGAHRADLHWQLDPAARVQVGQGSLSVERERTRMEMAFTCDRPLALTQARGQKEPLLGWFSSTYGKLETAPTVRVTAEGTLPLVVTTEIRIAAK